MRLSWRARGCSRPLATRAGRDREPDRLDRASDDSRPRPSSDRRLRRLPRGARARRRRPDRPRGDRDPRVRAAHVAHARRLPARDRRRVPAGRGAVRPTGTRLCVQLFHGGREQIATAPRSPALAPSAVPSPVSARSRERRAATSSSRSSPATRGSRARGRGWARRGRDLRGASLPDRAVLRSRAQSSRATPGPRACPSGDRAGQFALPRPDSRSGRAFPVTPGTRRRSRRSPSREGVDYLSVALGESSSYLGSVGIVPPPPCRRRRRCRPCLELPARSACRRDLTVVDPELLRLIARPPCATPRA